jgi:methylated-DNA-[protein]-cysteine S-methyltransferase
MMNNIFFHHYHSPLGELLIASYNKQLCLCDWAHKTNSELRLHRIAKHLNASLLEQIDDTLTEAITQLDQYFLRDRTLFTLSTLLIGTVFQQSVWNALSTVLFSQTVSYQTIANQIGKPKAVRAVANACGANPLSIIIPCHRIIGSNGKLVGYAGGVDIKQGLLKLERAQ